MGQKKICVREKKGNKINIFCATNGRKKKKKNRKRPKKEEKKK